MFQELGAFLPRLLVALAILVVGWIIALVTSAIVRRLLHRTSIDNRIAEWLLGGRGRTVAVERAAGTAVFWLVILFVLVAGFQSLRLTAVADPLNAMLGQVAAFAPQLLGALLLAFVAAAIALGLGGREVAGRQVEQWAQHLKDTR